MKSLNMYLTFIICVWEQQHSLRGSQLTHLRKYTCESRVNLHSSITIDTFLAGCSYEVARIIGMSKTVSIIAELLGTAHYLCRRGGREKRWGSRLFEIC